jgi:hypothetical protein
MNTSYTANAGTKPSILKRPGAVSRNYNKKDN